MNMKKILLVLTLLLGLLSLTSCNKVEKAKQERKENNIILVGASSTPHAEILEYVKPLLAEKGYELQIRIFDDYVLPNEALNNGELDANYFQHTPYLNSYNKEKKTDLVSAGIIHYEPFGLYGNGISDLKNVPAGTKIIVPADSSNETRALLLLAQEGLIELDPSKTIDTGITTFDITNSNGYKVEAVQADMVPAQFKSESNVLAVINGNYALGANISISTALATEAKDGAAALTYGNIIAVQNGEENDARVKALVEVLTSETVKNWITTNYNGAVLPL
jgi:D-methionine transport system substrate-binding protein